jgi:hypothetical protein
MEVLSEVARLNPWSILGWLVVAFVVGLAGWSGIAGLMDRWRNSWRNSRYGRTA